MSAIQNLDELDQLFGNTEPPKAEPIARIEGARARSDVDAVDQLFGGSSGAPTIKVDPELQRAPLRYGSFKVAPGGAPSNLRADMGFLRSDVEKYNFLASKFGKDNVLPVLPATAERGSEIVGFRFRASPKDPWQLVDPAPTDQGQGNRIASTVRDAVGDIADVAGPFVAESVPSTVGALAGQAAMPFLPGVGGILGGAAGDAAGPYIRDAYASTLPGYDPEEHDTKKDAVFNVSIGAALGAAPVIGRFLKPGARQLARKAGAELVLDEGAEKVAARPGRELIEERMGLAARTGVDLTPGQATGSRHLLQLQDAASSIGPHADKIRAVEINQQRQANAFLQRTLDMIGPDADPASAGTAVSRAYERYLNLLKTQRQNATRPLYEQAEKALGGERVIPVNNFLDTVDDMIARYDAPGGSPGRKAIVSQLRQVRSNLVAEGGQRGGVSVSELSAMMSDWGSSARPDAELVFKDADPRRARAVAARLFGALKDDMARAADDPALGPAAGALREANAKYAELSKPIEEARSSLLQKALKMTDESPDVIGATFAQSRSPAQIQRALSVLAKAEKADPELAGTLVGIKRDMLDALVAGAESGAESVRSRVDISPQKFASMMSKSKARAKVMAVIAAGGDGAEAKEALRAWNDSIEIMSVISDRGLPPGSPTASRLLNSGAADNAAPVIGATVGALAGPKGALAGGALGGALTKGRAYLNSKMLADIVADPLKRDEFYALIASGGRGMSGAGKAWAGVRALTQLGAIEFRDDNSNRATPEQIEQERNKNPSEYVTPRIMATK